MTQRICIFIKHLWITLLHYGFYIGGGICVHITTTENTFGSASISNPVKTGWKCAPLFIDIANSNLDTNNHCNTNNLSHVVSKENCLLTENFSNSFTSPKIKLARFLSLTRQRWMYHQHSTTAEPMYRKRFCDMRSDVISKSGNNNLENKFALIFRIQ